MSVTRRGRVSWRVEIELPRDPETGLRRRRKFTVRGNKKTAEKAERDALYELEHGVDVAPDKLTLGQWLQRWLDETAGNRVRATTLRRYRSIGKRITALIGDVRLQHLRPAHLDRMYARLRKDGLTNQTVTHYHRLMHNALRTAVRLQLVATNAALGVDPPKPDGKDVKALTPAQIGELLSFMGQLADEAQDLEQAEQLRQLRRLADVTWTTGPRIGEILGLSWSTVDLQTGRIRIERALVYTPGVGISYEDPKTDAGRRSITLAAKTTAAFTAQRKAQLEMRMRHADVWEDHGLVFTDPLGRPLKPYSVSQRFSRIATKAGFPSFTFHGLRHSHATLLLRERVPDKIAAERLGHANANVTRLIYQHVHDDMQDEVAGILDRALDVDDSELRRESGRSE